MFKLFLSVNIDCTSDIETFFVTDSDIVTSKTVVTLLKTSLKKEKTQIIF